MKHDLNHLDLRGAFREEPEKCHRALMDAARSIKEENDMTYHSFPRRSLRVALIALVALLLTGTVAMAAGSLFGWTNFFTNYGVTLDPNIQATMVPEKPLTHVCGPVRFTVQERGADAEHALISTLAVMEDGTSALFCAEADMAMQSYEEGVLQAQALGIDPSLTYAEAAKATGLPLYTLRALIEVDEEYDAGVGMEEVISSDTATVCFSMHDLQNVGSLTKLPISIYFSVMQIDPETLEATQVWRETVPYHLPVLPEIFSWGFEE